MSGDTRGIDRSELYFVVLTLQWNARTGTLTDYVRYMPPRDRHIAPHRWDSVFVVALSHFREKFGLTEDLQFSVVHYSAQLETMPPRVRNFIEREEDLTNEHTRQPVRPELPLGGTPAEGIHDDNARIERRHGERRVQLGFVQPGDIRPAFEHERPSPIRPGEVRQDDE